MAVFWGLLGPGETYAEESSYETVVTSSKVEEPVFESPRAIEASGHQHLQDRSPTTTPQALEDEVGLTMQRTNSAGGAPILRGLLGQHVLLMVDGIRLNNAITRFGPNQLLNTVDPFQLQRVEVMRGPGSVLYGSDALGGVVNLISRKPTFDPRRTWDASAELVGRFDSASSSMVGNLGMEGHLRGVGLRVGGSGKHFGDLMGGRDTGEQRFTAYREGDADLSAAWVVNNSSVLRLSYATVRQHDAPRTDRSSTRDFLRFTDQLRDLAAISYSGRWDHFFIKQVDAKLSLSSQRELRERFRLDDDRIERERDSVSTLGAQLALQSDLPYNLVTLGADLYNDWVLSSAESEEISAPIRTFEGRGRYIDDSRYLQLGVYLMDRISIGRKLALDIGGRVSTWNVQIPADLSNRINKIAATNTGVVGSLHGRYLLGDGLNLVAGVSQGYRAPNVDDYSAQGCSGQGYDVPNPDLAPERSVTAEAGVKIDLFGVLSGSLFYYFTYLDDLIVRVQTGEPTTFVCGRPMEKKKRDNAKEGQIHGVELSLNLALGRRWALFSWTTWTQGEVTLDLPGQFTEPLGRVPPLNGLAGVRYTVPEKGFVELAVRWAGHQDRLSTDDRGDNRICPEGPVGCDGTPGYAMLALRGAVRLNKVLRLTLSLNNLTNATYRVHGSGIDGPGLSAVLGMELSVK